MNETGDHRVIPLPAPSALVARILSASSLAELNAPWQPRRAIASRNNSRVVRNEEMSQ